MNIYGLFSILISVVKCGGHNNEYSWFIFSCNQCTIGGNLL